MPFSGHQAHLGKQELRGRLQVVPGRITVRLCLQALGSMIRYPNQMSFDIMENGGMLPPPQGVLLVEIVRMDKIVGGGRIFKVCPGSYTLSLTSY